MLLALLVGLIVYIDLSLDRVDALAGYPGRVADTPGTNWLIVGSDSRSGLSEQEQSTLATGDVAGRRTDTIMLLHISSSGEPTTLVSLPRDSEVTIPGQGENKLNAAFSIGGPSLLVRTVETATGVHIDHYAQIGFGGFAGIVDDVGGVEICLEEPLTDPKAGIDLPAGCQELTGAQALGYVRSRATAGGDLDRVMRQRQFLGALVDRIVSPAVLANPLRMVPLVTGMADALTVDSGDHVWHLARLAWALRRISGDGVVTTTVPIAGFGQLSNGGSTVIWDEDAASALFEALANDEPVPSGVLSR